MPQKNSKRNATTAGRTGRSGISRSSPDSELGKARDALLDAAIETIIERGIYRASSNQIAERAGVSWGSIQHHFKNREGVLLAVMERECDSQMRILSSADLKGSTTREKLQYYVDLSFRYYATDRYGAILQIHNDLSRDPAAKPETRAALTRIANSQWVLWQGLFSRAFGPSLAETGLDYVVHAFFRSLAIGENQRSHSDIAISDVLRVYISTSLAHMDRIMDAVATMIDTSS